MLRGTLWRTCVGCGLLLLVSGCSFYRYNNYSLKFEQSVYGPPSPSDRRQLEVEFSYKIFPLNAPRSIHTNLNEKGMVALRLPNHFPTAFILLDPSHRDYIWFRVDLHGFRRSPEQSIEVRDYLTGSYILTIAKVSDSKQ